MRYVVRIADDSESSNSRTHAALPGSREHVCLSVWYPSLSPGVVLRFCGWVALRAGRYVVGRFIWQGSHLVSAPEGETKTMPCEWRVARRQSAVGEMVGCGNGVVFCNANHFKGNGSQDDESCVVLWVGNMGTCLRSVPLQRKLWDDTNHGIRLVGVPDAGCTYTYTQTRMRCELLRVPEQGADCAKFKPWVCGVVC